MILLVLACATAPSEAVFQPRAHLAGRIQTPFGALRSSGIQRLCSAPEVRVGTVIDVAEPRLQPSGLRTQRLTLTTERTLRGGPSETFLVDTIGAQSHAPAPGPGRYLLATSTSPERIVVWATLDVDPQAVLPKESRLRADLDGLCAQAADWPTPPDGRLAP